MRPQRTRIAGIPNISWSNEEVALTLFLRSRRVLDRGTVRILNERYAPTVRGVGAVRNKLKAIRKAAHASGDIDLTHDKKFSSPGNVDQWIRGQIRNPDELSRLLTFTQHELEIMETNLPELNSARRGSLVVAGPSQVPPNRRMPRPENIQSSVGPSQMPASQEPRRRGSHGPGAGSSQALDPRTGQVMGGQSQMSGSSVRPNETGWLVRGPTLERLFPEMAPVRDSTLERLFPDMDPLSLHGGFPFGVQPTAGNGGAQDPYQERRAFGELHSRERGDEGEDEVDEDEDDEDEDDEHEDDEDDDDEDGDEEYGDDEDDDDGLNEYRPQRDENDNCWYDEDQEELDG